MPALKAFCAATDVGSSVPPRSEPGAMLMTFTPSATALLIASATVLLAPVQPNTRYAEVSAPGAPPGPTFQAGELMVLALCGPRAGLPSLARPKPAARR